jgi:hypothetical protein
MMKASQIDRRSFVKIIASGLLLLLALPVDGGLAKSSVYTPAKGSKERKAIMDAMRAKGDDQDRVFVVTRLKVSNGWAWLDANPQSSDGSNRYESESALLQKQGSRWRVIDQPCGESDCDYAAELDRIQADYPDAPEAIFP